MEGLGVDIFVEYEFERKKKNLLLEVPNQIIYSKFKEILNQKILPPKLSSYYIILRGKKYYDKENLKDIIIFENGDKVNVVNTRVNEKFSLIENINVNEKDMTRTPLTGFLKLILIKYVSKYIDNINLIKYQEIKEIISELKKEMELEEAPKNEIEEIKSILNDKTGKDIISYSKYVCSVISDQYLNYLLTLVDQRKINDIYKYWSILSKYEIFNKDFEKNLFEAIENSYFDYSLINLSIYQQTKRNDYLQAMKNCPNLVRRNLFHGTQIDPIAKIITKGFLNSRRPFYGMGIYFTDMLDYVAFYCGGTDFDSRRFSFGQIVPVNSTFSCVGAEVFYSSGRITNIFDFNLYVEDLKDFPTDEELKSIYKDKCVEENGVHIAKVEPNQGQVRTTKEIIEDKQRGRFIGTEYVITEKSQILPLYGLTFKRNEYFVLWKDPNFACQNNFSNFLKERQLFIYKYAKMNVYFESSTEKALEIIKRKRFNKIILISNIGLDLSGKKFVEIARKILGYDIVVLFFSNNQKHFSWLQSFPNALYTNDANFYQEYILNYNSDGLLKLKSKIEKHYGIKLKFNDNFSLYFPSFINTNAYTNVIFEEINPYFKKVIIKNSKNNSLLCMENNGDIKFKSFQNLDINLYIWYITILGNEMTLFSNGFYLGGNIQERKVTRDPYMKRYFFEIFNNTEFIFYYENKDNILTENGNLAIFQKINNNNITNQIFKLLELIFY